MQLCLITTHADSSFPEPKSIANPGHEAAFNAAIKFRKGSFHHKWAHKWGFAACKLGVELSVTGVEHAWGGERRWCSYCLIALFV